MDTSSFILPWGHTNERVEYLENALLSRGLVNRKKLNDIYRSCNRTLPPDHLLSEYQRYEYWVTLAQLCEDYDWDLYMENPVDHDINNIYFVFDPQSDMKPIYQYPYGCIYEYVAYMENAIVSLLYGTLEELRMEFHNDINEYAGFLEAFSSRYDNKIMDELDPSLWFHPMRRYNQIRFNDLSESIAFLEHHIVEQRMVCKKALRRMRSHSGNETGYLIMLQYTLYGMIVKNYYHCY